MTPKNTAKIAENLKGTGIRKNAPVPPAGTSDWLSTGSTLLNLAISGHPMDGFLKGKYYFLVGDAASGKTFLSMTCLTEATLNPSFKDYRFIYDNIEDGLLIDLKRLFNEEVARRVEPPATEKDGMPIYSETIEEFYYNMDDAIKSKQPFIYILDSMDALSSYAEIEKFEEAKDAHRKGKTIAGSYAVSKAKQNSAYLRRTLRGLQDTGSILLILSQTRDNLGFGFTKKTRSGGHALRFYATVEIWSDISKTITKHIKGKRRQIGVGVHLRVRKNRITGLMPEVETLIYPSYGIDDIGSCIDYLVDEGWWEKTGTKIEAKEFNLSLSRRELITALDEKDKIQQLQIITGKCWKEIENASALKRKQRYKP